MTELHNVKKHLPSSPTTIEPVVRADWARFICGGVAGTVSRTMTAPIDRVKVLRQTGVVEMVGKNFIQSWRIMYAEGGITSMWRGNGVNVLKNCPESAIRFGMHGWLKSTLFPEAQGNLKPEQRLLVASLAGATSLTCTYPVEILKTRMALRKSTDPRSISQCVRRVYAQGGMRGFYRGYKISMLSYVPYSGMELAIYEMFKRRYLRYRSSLGGSTSETHVPALVTIALVTVSCAIPILIVYPANLLRTRFQASDSPRAAPVIPSLRAIWNQSGLTGLYQGMGASLSKTLPSVCITYVVFEFTSELLRVPGLGSR
ncbi:solute carrier family 25 (mitochondrial phosphate transporter), member 23/24/25/41 [Paragonimus westermani]|uniref:Solute carrier family 25 (Mitochondrial phosphate transporter), member 23/24/25/41 n=1 Tax=Paragonimus westermani TaxID=34504 RepID=A0A5J4P4Y9_9TREM|nr:solute carrier family 25 (mitochondrial phosphate transporter), member 23/24/25/41 [Paragonimus westermani]